MRTQTPLISYIQILAASICIISLATPYPHVIPLLFLSIAGILTVIDRFRNQPTPPHHFHPFVFILMVIASLLISLPGSVNIERSVVLSVSFFWGFVLFAVIVSGIRGGGLYELYAAFSLIGWILSAYALTVVWESPKGSPQIWMKILANPNLWVPNDLTLLLALTIPFSISLLLSPMSGFVKTAAAFSILLSLSAVVLYQSRGALMLILISCSSTVVCLQSRRLMILMAVLLASAVWVDMLCGMKLISKFSGIWTTRILYWKIAWAMFADAPFLGNGPRTFGALYHSYKQTIQIPEWIAVDNRFTPWAHNLYLETLSEQGILGLAPLVLFFGSNMKTSWQLACRSSHKETRIMGTGAFAGMLILIAGSVFELSFIRYWVVITVFAVTGIIAALAQNEQNPEKG